MRALLTVVSKRGVTGRNNVGSSSTSTGSSAVVLRTFSSQPFYSPTLAEKRVGQGGKGGRTSEAGIKVAVFGGSGFLGTHVCGELGTL